MANTRKAFTLIELLVVITIIALLVSILMPALSKSRQQARKVVCLSNLKQLVMANTGYAVENNDRYVLAAEGIIPDNLKRWHGERDDIESPFEPERSPLYKYLGDGEVKQCPDFRNYHVESGQAENFEAGCGGYGYNDQYIGGRLDNKDYMQACNYSAKSSEVKHPSETIMFADSAFATTIDGGPAIIEYSFIHPPIWANYVKYVIEDPESASSFAPQPSIHFRHLDTANAGWADGHVTSEKMTIPDEDPYGFAEKKLGWFGPGKNNSIYDLK